MEGGGRKSAAAGGLSSVAWPQRSPCAVSSVGWLAAQAAAAGRASEAQAADWRSRTASRQLIRAEARPTRPCGRGAATAAAGGGRSRATGAHLYVRIRYLYPFGIRTYVFISSNNSVFFRISHVHIIYGLALCTRRT